MTNLNMAEPLIYSDFGDDPDLGELVEMFVADMPKRIAAFQNALDAKNWELLRQAAHQIKGAAGSYGFGVITHTAYLLDSALRAKAPESELTKRTVDLIEICQRARAGTAPLTT